ncbi:MAG: adenylosuccinate lyase [Bacteroidales bacterium]|nr:adenylosuccinate lyase [Bacteroidales bacterium]
MNLAELTAISPVDGRYRSKIVETAKYFSEFGLIKYRLITEVEYFIALCEIPLPQLKCFDKKVFRKLRKVIDDFSLQDAQKIKDIEKITNHDVKAVEYFLKEKFDEFGLSEHKEFIHFGLTSQDINNTATPMLLRDAFEVDFLPSVKQVIEKLFELSEQWADIPMLARTHGQPASPTKLGKEIEVFIERLRKQISHLQLVPFSAKFGGATGNFNAHYVAYPEIDWVQFANSFVNHVLNLDRSQTTTQIEHYDNLAAFFDNLKRINTILIDMSRDFWTYISQNYFKQKINKNEVGSSAMPHKVNPIDFENAEGNLGIANALYEHFSAKLPISRLQRDLTDSTVLRNIGVPIAHSMIAFKSLLKGLGKLELNETAIQNDLQNNYVVVAEAIQTILRRENYPNPYEALKDLTRTNKVINAEVISEFVDGLDVSDDIKQELKQITPENYTGI